MGDGVRASGLDELAACVPAADLLSIAEDGGIRLGVLSAQGKWHYANACMVDRLRSRMLDAPLNDQSLPEIMPKSLAESLVGVVGHVLTTGRPVLFDWVLDSVRKRTIVRKTSWKGEPAVLLVCRDVEDTLPLQPPELHGFDLMSFDSADDGPLSGLTDRELEILRLIGEGLSTEQIAHRLERSVKTVEWHRVSLGSKLGVSNRVELARIAIKAGLSSMNGYLLPKGSSGGR